MGVGAGQIQEGAGGRAGGDVLTKGGGRGVMGGTGSGTVGVGSGVLTSLHQPTPHTPSLPHILSHTHHHPLTTHPQVSGDEWSDCAKKGLAVKPVQGDALLFYSLKPDGSTDPASLHGSCPTTKGEKWSATKWIHVGPFQ